MSALARAQKEGNLLTEKQVCRLPLVGELLLFLIKYGAT